MPKLLIVLLLITGIYYFGGPDKPKPVSPSPSFTSGSPEPEGVPRMHINPTTSLK